MKHIVRLRWIVPAVWIAAAVLLMWQAPDMAKLVREKGQLTVPDGYPSKIAGEILDKHSSKEKGVESFIVVFHSEEKLTDSQLGEIENTVNRLKNEKDRLSIESVTTHFGDKDLESQLVSKDGKTVMTLLNVKMKGKEVKDVRKPLEQAIHTKDVDAYMTGNSLINEDVVISSEKGLAKTEVITVIFILIGDLTSPDDYLIANHSELHQDECRKRGIGECAKSRQGHCREYRYLVSKTYFPY